MFAVCVLLFALTYQQQLVNVTVPLLNQLGSSSGGAILCQRLLDHRGAPLLLAADDLLLSSAALNATLGCQALQLTFATTRTRSDSDPRNVTVQLLRSDPLNRGPGALFFQRTLGWPPLPLGAAPLQLALREGDWDDAGMVQFQLQNASFWPRDLAVWVALYVSMPVDPLPTSQNAFFWLTQAPALHNSSMFYYRDAWGFVNWTNASVAAPKLSLSAGTTQMQWSAALQCQTLATAAPTGQPSAPTPPPAGNESLAPVYENVTTDVNSSLYAPGGARPVAIAVAVPVALVVALALSALLVYQLRRRRWLVQQKQRERQQERTVQMVNIREKLLGPEPPTISFDDALYRRNPLHGTQRVFTSGSEMVEVPLRNPQGPYAQLLNDSIVTTSDGE